MTKKKLDLIEKLIRVHREGLDMEGGGSALEGWTDGHFWVSKAGVSGWSSGEGHKQAASGAWRAKDDENVAGLDTLLPELISFARSKL